MARTMSLATLLKSTWELFGSVEAEEQFKKEVQTAKALFITVLSGSGIVGMGDRFIDDEMYQVKIGGSNRAILTFTITCRETVIHRDLSYKIRFAANEGKIARFLDATLAARYVEQAKKGKTH